MSMKAFLEKLSRDEMTTYGLVLESDLRQVVTLSVGQITINDVMISYHGVQKVVKDNEGRPVYGGPISFVYAEAGRRLRNSQWPMRSASGLRKPECTRRP